MPNLMMKKLKEGRIHIYTGAGKGKTTASMGLALRAASNGLKVCMFQFLKKKDTSCENNLSVTNFKVVCLNEIHPMFLEARGRTKAVVAGLKKKILNDLKKVKTAIRSGRYDVVILDEIINCVSQEFLEEGVVLDLIKAKPKNVELVLTGRSASKRLIGSADYVTRLAKVKHPFDGGLLARRGIEY